MSLVLKWIDEGVPNEQFERILNGFSVVGSSVRLDKQLQSTCNSHIENYLLLHPLPPSTDHSVRCAAVSELVYMWINLYLVHRPQDDELLSGLILAHS